MINNLSTNKALAYDGISDELFRPSMAAQTARIMNDIWSIDWNKVQNSQIFFKTRLIPLNKKHPKTPSPDDFRPIIVTSPIVKLMEVRIYSKLQKYLTEKMHRGQTGFVRGMGTQINLYRINERIKQKILLTGRCYGLFIDFKSAYNTVLHSKLFKRLEGILEPIEIEFIKALYSRMEISMEDSSFRPNIGVPQGSIISPALFDIYVEPLYKQLEKAKVSPEDALGYADDLNTLCDTPAHLMKVLRIIIKWAEDNNQIIRMDKSGIVVFGPRRGRWDLIWKYGDSRLGVPVVDRYKYLGFWITPRMQLELQKEHIEKKIRFLLSKLYPVLRGISLDYRINLWKIMAKPLFDQILCALDRETSDSNVKKITILSKMTFKSFTLLGKTVPNRIINYLMNYDVQARAKRIANIAKRRWENRLYKRT